MKDLLARADRAERLGLRDDDDLETQLVHLRSELPYKLRELGSKDSRHCGQGAGSCRKVRGARRGRTWRPCCATNSAKWIAAYGELKHRSGKLDFLDLLISVRNLLRDNAAVRAELQAQFTHIFVDEFQDTDPLQMQILLLLSAEDPREQYWLNARPVPGKLFVVGDPKQSIYKFRRARRGAVRRGLPRAGRSWASRAFT